MNIVAICGCRASKHVTILRHAVRRYTPPPSTLSIHPSRSSSRTICMHLLFARVKPVVSINRTASSGLRWASSISRQHEPLRILFCGADQFSIYSLKALHRLQSVRPDKIESIDVLCRNDKRVGRGLKQIQEGMFILQFLTKCKCMYSLSHNSAYQACRSIARTLRSSDRHLQRLEPS